MQHDDPKQMKTIYLKQEHAKNMKKTLIPGGPVLGVLAWGVLPWEASKEDSWTLASGPNFAKLPILDTKLCKVDYLRYSTWQSLVPKLRSKSKLWKVHL